MLTARGAGGGGGELRSGRMSVRGRGEGGNAGLPDRRRRRFRFRFRFCFCFCFPFPFPPFCFPFPGASLSGWALIHAVHTESESSDEEGVESEEVDKSEDEGWSWRPSWFMSSTELGWSCAWIVSTTDWMCGFRTGDSDD